MGWDSRRRKGKKDDWEETRREEEGDVTRGVEVGKYWRRGVWFDWVGGGAHCEVGKGRRDMKVLELGGGGVECIFLCNENAAATERLLVARVLRANLTVITRGNPG
jgi:hypothetical protein